MSIDAFFKPSGQKSPAKKRKIDQEEANTAEGAAAGKAEGNKMAKVDLQLTPFKDCGPYGTLHMELEPSWAALLAAECKKPYFKKIVESIFSKSEAGQKIFPPPDKIFNAFNLCPYNETRVVILGQDPYHGAGQAEGLSFSVPEGVAVPPSLRNIYKELEDDIPGFKRPKHGHLAKWAQQGVLLLNTVLTVTSANANSHKDIGWEIFTSAVIDILAKNKKNVVFILWGAHAQKKAKSVNEKVHKIIKSAHPSPLSAHNGFYGSKFASKTNEYLIAHKLKPIDWTL